LIYRKKNGTERGKLSLKVECAAGGFVETPVVIHGGGPAISARKQHIAAGNFPLLEDHKRKKPRVPSHRSIRHAEAGGSSLKVSIADSGYPEESTDEKLGQLSQRETCRWGGHTLSYQEGQHMLYV
jgi:hypothetical protein